MSSLGLITIVTHPDKDQSLGELWNVPYIQILIDCIWIFIKNIRIPNIEYFSKTKLAYDKNNKEIWGRSITHQA